MQHAEQAEEQLGYRWLGRPRASFLVSVVAFATPIVLSIAAALVAAALLPHPASAARRVLWWVALLVITLVAALLGERIARSLLPLSSLLKMSLLFPDRAPSRFAVARRANSTRQLDRYIHGLDDGVRREPVTAAVEILTLVTALSSHDRRTRGHSERVRAYTDLIADELRLPEADRDRLRWAALLHDVGKITVHADILNKAGKPSEKEWEILRQHPLEGQRILEPLREWLGEWGLAAAQHHENFDGTGYPFGISGEQISLGARIVSVADAFDTMTSARSYKSAMSPAAARKELTRCAGAQFDPAIVRAFLNISVGRQRWIIGPLSWLFDVPLISQLSTLGNAVVASSQVALVVGSVSLGAVAVAGGVTAHHPASAQSPNTLAVSRTNPQSGTGAAPVPPTGTATPPVSTPGTSLPGSAVVATTTTGPSTSSGSSPGSPLPQPTLVTTTTTASQSTTSTTNPTGTKTTTPTTVTTDPTTTTTAKPTTTTTTKAPTTTTTVKPPATTTTTVKPPVTTTTKAPTTTTTVKPPATTTTTTQPCVIKILICVL